MMSVDIRGTRRIVWVSYAGTADLVTISDDKFLTAAVHGKFKNQLHNADQIKFIFPGGKGTVPNEIEVALNGNEPTALDERVYMKTLLTYVVNRRIEELNEGTVVNPKKEDAFVVELGG